MHTALIHGPWGYGPGFPFFLFAPILWIAVIVVVALLLRRGARRRWARYGGPAFGPHRSPEATLGDRFANGEIDEVDYRSRLEVLRANRPA